MRTRHTTRLLSGGLGLVALVLLWFYLAPVGLGGSTSYVVTDGISMEPRFHTGDLALVRGQDSYRVGEVVAYHSRMLHTIVLHRIIGRSGGRYVFKGDNNHFVDPEHPAAGQLIGALWLHIPGVGTSLESLRSPALLGILLALATLLFTGAAFTRRRRLRRRQRRAGENAGHPSMHPRQSVAGPAAGVLAIGLVALLGFVVLALVAYTRPSTARSAFHVPYKQSGTFSYSANAAPGPTYPGDVAVTGDPLFTHVVSAVDLRFGYLFHAAAAHSLRGRASLSATIASPSGWHTTLQLGGPTYFHGDRVLIRGRLDLASLLALLHRVETMTAVSSGSYTLTLVPRVSATGSLAAQSLHTTFSPQIQFSLSKLEAQPVLPPAGSPAAGQSSATPFAPSASGSVKGGRYQPLSLSLGVARPSVATARAVAITAITIIVGALLVMLAFVRPRVRDESAAIRARYGRLIVAVERVWQLPGVAVIDVADMEALVRIADHYDRSILHETTAAGEAFWVSDESGQFRYTVAAPAWMAEGEVVDESSRAPAVDGEVVDESPSDALVDDVYADELALGGLVRRRRPSAYA
jgi:signal peptidase I